MKLVYLVSILQVQMRQISIVYIISIERDIDYSSDKPPFSNPPQMLVLLLGTCGGQTQNLKSLFLVSPSSVTASIAVKSVLRCSPSRPEEPRAYARLWNVAEVWSMNVGTRALDMVNCRVSGEGGGWGLDSISMIYWGWRYSDDIVNICSRS